MFILYMHSDESGNNWTKSFKLEHIFETFENVECLKIRLFNYLNLNFGKNSDELGLLKMSSSWIDKYYGYTFDFFQSNQIFIYS